MLVIKIELWPHGDESKKEDMGTAHIWNDGTGTRTSGNYGIKIFKSRFQNSHLEAS